jgi:hypothetical protein
VEVGDGGVGGESPDQGMFTGSGADHKKLHKSSA